MHDLILKEFTSSLPCGEDCKYEDSFLLIEQEVDKTNSVTQDGSTDWKIVVKNSEQFLISESKDLKIASWLTYGLWRNDSWKGLKNGILIYNKLLEKFEKSIYPKSKKAKTNIFSWLEDTLTNDILANENSKKTITNELEFLELFKSLNKNINIHLESENNNFRKIIQFLEDLIKEKNIQISKEKEIKEKEEKTPLKNQKNNQPINNKINNEIVEINNESDAIKVLRSFKKSGSLLTNYYRKQNISNLKALRITRLFTWLDTEGLPNSENNKTFLHPPSELELDELENLYKNKEYDDAFYLAEEILEVSPFWIDGHLYSYNILEKTKNYNEAKEIKNTLISFLKTNNGILDLHFVDNTPFASKKAKKWIQEELTSKEESSDNTDKEETIDDNEELLSIIYELANDNKIKEAMNLLNQKYYSSSNTEEKFNWRLHHAELAIEFNKKEIALALLEELEKDIEKFHLNEWNPKLASKVYNLLLTSFSSIDIHSDKLDLIYKNLCKTDINSAFEIKIN
ncbi:type VI secretion system protein TssA [Arcobacter sp. LA11]|uniref:type VI secretion system protein TssA n=1 Tax=Arcobacter sp. LA11 TaxID=1898176 RepID=UPI00157702D2|nr:type VI secretion system protein TssA [Arcobacter sp. LA11]